MVRSVVCIAVLTAFVSAAAAADEVGRYQLFQGQYAIQSSRGEQTRQNDLFRIDTGSGRTWIAESVWRCPDGPASCRQIRTWVEFDTERNKPAR